MRDNFIRNIYGYTVSIFPAALIEQTKKLAEQCTAQSITIATAESCTGGLLSALLTELPGSSAWFTHGFITYANDAKISMLNVDPALITQHGAVSEPVARAMASGAKTAAKSTVAISITGIAGPSGGSAEKPVGLVHMALANRDSSIINHAHHFTGDRSAVRMHAVAAALAMLLKATA
jgi:nicotinamide-nucleotide amidase